MFIRNVCTNIMGQYILVPGFGSGSFTKCQKFQDDRDCDTVKESCEDGTASYDECFEDDHLYERDTSGSLYGLDTWCRAPDGALVTDLCDMCEAVTNCVRP